MRKQGFTVIELVIVSAIFVSLFAVSVANYRQAEKTETMRTLGHQLTSDISWLQTAAITGTSSDHGMGFAYGIRAIKNSDNYTMFRDDNNNKMFDSNTDRIVRRVYFSGDFIISDITLGETSVEEITTVFLPPRPTVYTNEAISQAVYLKISRGVGSEKSVLITIDPVTGRSKQSFVTE